MKGDWFTSFKESHNLEFTKEDYKGWEGMVGKDLPIYLKYLPTGSSMLECCCGMGCTAIPLSHYYKVTAFDKDERILEYTKKNAIRFGGNEITIANADFRKIDEIFGPNSFDACSSGGVLEHFPISDIHNLVDIQLKVAPIVFISIPLGTGSKTTFTDTYGITRYDYNKDQWIDEILNRYNVSETLVSKPHPKVAGNIDYENLFVVLKR